jgi:hypothetical protein
LSDVQVTLKGKEGGPAKNLYPSIYLSNYLVHYTLNYPERQTDRKKEKKMKNNEEFCKKPTAPGVPKRSPIQVEIFQEKIWPKAKNVRAARSTGGKIMAWVGVVLLNSPPGRWIALSLLG